MKLARQSLGFVPTMGVLHAGHLSLIRQARKDNQRVAVSIFVNPAQFGPREDFKKYPRALKRDAALCRKAGVDIIFYPDTEDMYPAGYRTYVTVEGLSDCLCGKSRPNHFRGVATVVAKLFNLVQPDRAYFGQKDAQQAVIIRKMVEDLNLAVEVKVMPTVRESDGLTMSSRNVYLSAQERRQALAIPQALQLAQQMIKKGELHSAIIIAAMRKRLNQAALSKVDYIAVVKQDTLEPVKRIERNALIALSAWVGKTRLIDNIVV